MDLGDGVRRGGIVYDGGNLWALNWSGGWGWGIAKYNAAGTLLGYYPVPSGAPYLLAYGGGFVFTNTSEGSLCKLDLSGNIVASRVGLGLLLMMFHDGLNLWVRIASTLYKLADDLSTILATTVATITDNAGCAFDGTSLWIPNPLDNSISKINRTTGAIVASYTGFPGPSFMTVLSNGLLAVSCGDNAVRYVNPSTGAVVSTLAVQSPQQLIADANNRVYIPTFSNNTIEVISDPLSERLVYEVGLMRIEREDISFSTGVSVDECRVILHCDKSTVFNTLTVPHFAMIGGFDNAQLKIEIAIMPSYDDTSAGVLHLFEGRVTDVVMDMAKVELTVSSLTILLDTKIPKMLYQPSCTHNLYSDPCGVSRASFTVDCTVLSGSHRGGVVLSSAQVAGFFLFGKITFLTGKNAGLSRTIRSHTINIDGREDAMFNEPLPFSPELDDAIRLVAGCDKSRATCTSKFSNALNFLGFEYMPVPEASI